MDKKLTEISILLSYSAISIWLIIISCLISSSLFAQIEVIDQLKEELQAAKSSSERVRLFNEIADEFWHYDLEEGLSYAAQALELAQSTNNISGKAAALANLGIGNIFLGKLELSEEYLLEAEKIYAGLPDSLSLAFVWNQLGTHYLYQSNYRKAHLYFEKQRTLPMQDMDSRKVHIRSYRRQAEIFLEQGNLRRAGEYIEKYMELVQVFAIDTFQIPEAFIQKAIYLKEIGDFSTSETILLSLFKGLKAKGDRRNQMEVMAQLGDLEVDRGNPRIGFEYFQEGMRMARELKDQVALAKFSAQIGDVFAEFDNHLKALEYYFEALKMLNNINNVYEKANLFFKIGFSYYYQRSYSEAEEYLEKSLSGFSQIENQNGIARVLNHRGLIHYRKELWDKSERDHKEALEIRKSLGNLKGQAASYYNLAITMEGKGKLNEALQYHLASLKIEEEIGNLKGQIISYNGLGRIYTLVGNYGEALSALQAAEKLIEDTDYQSQLRQTYEFYAQLYDSLGDADKALNYMRLFKKKSDEVFNENSARQLAQQQVLMELEEKNQEIQLLSKENELAIAELNFQKSQLRQQRLIIALFVLLLFSLSIIGYVLYYTGKTKALANEELKVLFRELSEKKEEIEAQSEELREANEIIISMNTQLEEKVKEKSQKLIEAYDELDTFFYRSSHDFRRPLTTLQGLAAVAKISVKDQEALHLFEKVNEIATSVDKMLSKFQTISLLGHDEMQAESLDWQTMVQDAVDQYAREIEQAKIQISIQINSRMSFFSFPMLIKVMLENMVENAVQFSKVQGFIHISVDDENEGVLLKISDNGDGIDPKYHEKIFDMYFRANERAKGNGLGLFIVKKIIEKLRGMVYVQSEYGKGAIFTIFLPNLSER